MNNTKLKCVLLNCTAKQFEMQLNKTAYSQLLKHLFDMRLMHTSTQSIDRILCIVMVYIQHLTMKMMHIPIQFVGWLGQKMSLR